MPDVPGKYLAGIGKPVRIQPLLYKVDGTASMVMGAQGHGIFAAGQPCRESQDGFAGGDLGEVAENRLALGEAFMPRRGLAERGVEPATGAFSL